MPTATVTTNAISDDRIRKILTLPGEKGDAWQRELERFEKGDVSLTRQSAGEAAIKAMQRLLIFLGYSTSSTGAFSIDGDFGRGTNRAVAQFQFEYKLNPALKRALLCYACNWQTARANIVAIPDTRLDVPTLSKMLDVALQAIDRNEVMCGSFDEALVHLNGLHKNEFYDCKRIQQRYGKLVSQAIARLQSERGITIQPEWVLSIIRQETAGVVRPRFEQHLLTRLNDQTPQADFAELRYRAMSFGLGQILGENYRTVGAASARAMFISPLAEQVLFVARFIAASGNVRAVIAKQNPTDADFHTLARYYNGAGYAKHHYHEKLARWFREFRSLA